MTIYVKYMRLSFLAITKKLKEIFFKFISGSVLALWLTNK